MFKLNDINSALFLKTAAANLSAVPARVCYIQTRWVAFYEAWNFI